MRKHLHFLVAAILSLTFCGVAAAPQTLAQTRGVEAQVESIRRIYAAVNKQIESGQPCRDAGENSESIFCVEIVINKGGRNRNNYPAVGKYEENHRFIYGFGEAEESSYPDALIKATSTSYNAARRYNAEFLFSTAGELIFYYSKAENDVQPEVRCYFAAGKPIRMIKGTTTSKQFSKADAAEAAEIMTNAKKLKEIFDSTLSLPTGFYEADENS